jgi:hypothetical protein
MNESAVAGGLLRGVNGGRRVFSSTLETVVEQKAISLIEDPV